MDSITIGTTLSSGLVIAVCMQFLKAIFERAGLKPTDALHDPTIQVVAGLVGVIGFVAHAASLAPLTGPVFWDNAAQGALAGLSAIVSFHVLSGPGTQTATIQTGENSLTVSGKDVPALLQKVRAQVDASTNS
jgi:hypothetical protein